MWPMVDAGAVIGIGVSLFGLGVAAHLGVDAWLRVKRFERESKQSPPSLPTDPDLAARLARIEQIVEITAVEVERVAEAQRFVARALSEQSAVRPPERRGPERVVTPH